MKTIPVGDVVNIYCSLHGEPPTEFEWTAPNTAAISSLGFLVETARFVVQHRAGLFYPIACDAGQLLDGIGAEFAPLCEGFDTMEQVMVWWEV